MRKENERKEIIRIIHDYCDNSGRLDESDFSRVIQQLLIALSDLEMGIVDPMFLPNEKKPNRPKRTTIGGFNQAMASAAMELYMRSGKIKREASKLVGKRLNKSGFIKQGRADSQCIGDNTVLGWRNEITKHHTSKNPSTINEYYKFYKFMVDRQELFLKNTVSLPIQSEDYEAVAEALLDELDYYN
jgi:hypothetical protein